jgi:F-type H+-transporting ATPase subunit delta
MKSSSMGSEIAEPYAKALMALAEQQDLADRIGEDVVFLRQALKGSEDLASFLASPIVKSDDKKSVLRQIAESQIHAYTLNFLMLLIDRGRILFLDDVCQRYQALLRQRNQAVLAQVTSAIELTEGQRQAISDKVKTLTNAREVELETKIDPDIIGGTIVRVGSQVLDASLKGQLRRLALRLNAG